MFSRKHDARSIHCWVKREQNLGQWFFLQAGQPGPLSAGSTYGSGSLWRREPGGRSPSPEGRHGGGTIRPRPALGKSLLDIRLLWTQSVHSLSRQVTIINMTNWGQSPGSGNLRQTETRQQSTETGPDSYTVQTLNWDWAHDCKMSTACLHWPIRVRYWVHWPIGGLALDDSVCIISDTSDICTQPVWSHHFFVLLWQTSLDFSVLDLFLQVKYENIPLLWIMNAKLSNIWFLLVHFPLFNRTDKREQMRKNFCLFNQTVCLFAICGRYNYLLLQNFLHLIKTNPFIISSLRDKSVKSL